MHIRSFCIQGVPGILCRSSKRVGVGIKLVGEKLSWEQGLFFLHVRHAIASSLGSRVKWACVVLSAQVGTFPGFYCWWALLGSQSVHGGSVRCKNHGQSGVLVMAGWFYWGLLLFQGRSFRGASGLVTWGLVWVLLGSKTGETEDSSYLFRYLGFVHEPGGGCDLG